MAPPRAVARDLRNAAKRIDAVADRSVQAGATAAIEHAAELGARRRVGRQPMRARVVATRRSSRNASITVWPVPAWAWSVRSSGRRTSRPKRKKALRFTGDRVVHAMSARGHGGDGVLAGWQEQARDAFVTAARDEVREAIDG